VYAFRQSQLQSYQQPAQQGFNVLDAIGKTALAAGALAGGIGLYRGLRGKGAVPEVKAPGTPASAPSVRQTIERAAGRTTTAPVPSQAPPATRPVAAVVTEAKPNLGVQITDLGTIARPTASAESSWEPWQGTLQIKSIPTEAQPVAPVAQERMVRRHGRMVPLSSVSAQTQPAVRSSQSFLTKAVQPSEEVLDRLAEDYEQRAAANIAGQHVGETMVDQHNAEALQHSYQSVAAVNSAEDQVTGRSIHVLQQDPHVDMSQVGQPSGFKAFSQRATDVSNWHKSVRDMWDLETMIEDLGQQNQALQTVRSQGAAKYTALDLMGALPQRGTTKTYKLSDFSDYAAQNAPKLSNSEIADRIMAAASASPAESQLLLNPAVPTNDVRHLLGSTLRGNAAVDFHSNPTYEVRSYGQMGLTDAERFHAQRLQEEAGPAAAQEFMAERLGGAGVITGLRERNNPEYDALLHNNLIPHWDELSNAGQLVPRNTTVTAEDVRLFNLEPERLHSKMSFNERKQLLDALPDQGGYEGARHRQTGQYLSDYAGYIGLNNVTPTIVEAGHGKPLIETRGFVERTNTGITFVPGDVELTKGNVPGSERFERSVEGVVPIRATRSGEESRGVYATNDPNRPFRLVPTEVTGSRQVGGYELPEATPHFMVGPAVSGSRNATTVAIKDNGQMVPVVQVNNRTVPVNRLDQIHLLAPEGVHNPGSEVLRIQPYMVGSLIETEAGTHVVSKPVYGPLMQRTSEGLVPTAINMAEAKQVAQDASATWRSNPNAKLDYLANTGNQSDIDYLNQHGYEVGQVATGPGTSRNVVTAMRVKTDLGNAERDSEGFIIPASVKSNVTPVDELGEPYHHTGYIADQLHQYFNASKKVGAQIIPGTDLPVLQDPSAKHHFVNDLLTVSTERDVHGSPYLGYTQNKTKDPLNVGRYAREWSEEKGGYVTNVLPGMRRQQGLTGADPMQYEDAGEAANLGTNVAFLTPRINTAPQRVQGASAPPNPAAVGGKRLAAALADHKERTGQALRPEHAVDFATSIAQQEGTDVNSVLREANKYSKSIGQTSEWTLIPKAAAAEANLYFPSAGETIHTRRQQLQEQAAPTAPQQANLQQVAARTLFSSVPDERQQAGVQHLANYISSAAKRVDQPLTWQGNTKLKGVGNNALMPYAPPSEGMIQALMLQARRR
jgi:hypothetical protein